MSRHAPPYTQCITLRAGLQVWAFVLPVTLLRLPYSLMEAVIWAVITYWAVGFAPDAGRARARSPVLSCSTTRSKLCCVQCEHAWSCFFALPLIADAVRACACHDERGVLPKC